MLEPARDSCVLEPFTHPRGAPVFPAALGGNSALMLGLNLQLQLFFLRPQTFEDDSKPAATRSVHKRATDD